MSLLAGCQAPYVPLSVLPNHPASLEGEGASMYQASTTLDKPKEELKNKDTEQKSAHSGHNMDRMSGIDMEGMNHASN